MGDWPIGGGGQNSCLVLVVIDEFDLRYCCSSKTSVSTFWLVDVFLQAPSGTLLSQDEIDQILQIWTSMQRQIVSPTTMIVINEEIINEDAALIYSCVKKAWKPQNISSFRG